MPTLTDKLNGRNSYARCISSLCESTWTHDNNRIYQSNHTSTTLSHDWNHQLCNILWYD